MATKKKATRRTTKKKQGAKAKPSTRKNAAKKSAAKKSAAKKSAAAKKTATKKRAAAKKKAFVRRDAAGHVTPKYARDLLARNRDRRDEGRDDRAFLRGARSKDDLAEELGEEAVATMTSGEDQGDRLEVEVDEERGGPFLTTRAGQEFARGTDESNPRSATREPFPKS